MNSINPKALMLSKWTKVDVNNKEKHFIVTLVKFDEHKKVIECVIEAVISKNEYPIDWRELKLSDKWLIGWQ
ncbi:TIGR02450 family Trp-rich protein [Moritella sp. Urea-trap-13]|uniref:TIGR02450 family Trp-rich protein n=1 Tax=Moritella sp. Urea-trap-13 TaxID=2058327 RepID=UPI000C326D02|nr:TIGR02450 family Trp-rich protein [Moritella sp. Urea-trap-13]PKH06360.1 TIGR02450 family Trp-rich protein [Moritella sp. Urea-trap-13]